MSLTNPNTRREIARWASGSIHCSWRPARRRNQELTARRVAGRTVYLPGIVL